MSTRVPALVVLLAALVLAPSVAVAGYAPVAMESAQASTPVVGNDTGTTNRLALPATEVETSTVGNASLDVASAIGTGTDAAAGEFTVLRLEEAFAAAETPEQRREVLRRSRDRIATRITDLRERERAALDAYNAGDIGTQAYLARLARIHAGATRLETAVGRLSEYASGVPEAPVTDDEIASLRARLLPLQGPVRERAIRSLTGEDERMRTYVTTSTTGVVLATLTGPAGEQYVRTAYLASARMPGEPDQFEGGEDHPFTVARDRAQELYPWVFENRLALSIGDPLLYRAGVYPVVIDHPHGVSRRGDLVTYLDGATTDAFLEHQYKRTSRLPTETLGTNESDGLRLVVNRTHAGGPLDVRVTTTNGTDVDAAVTLNGDDVGTTGLDGRLWTIAPDGRISVNATANGETVSVTRQTPVTSGG